ncbi:MAG: CAP domain-containing protein [Proteobacteria bacterium]|nr:CAP domain-containing protein [Pseudomonadota bacterium]
MIDRTLYAGRALLLLSLPLLMHGARADVLSAAQVLRAGGCGGMMSAAPALRHDPALDELARDWAEGLSLPAAARRHGVTAAVTGVRTSAPEGELLEVLRRQQCRTLLRPELAVAGSYHRRDSSWLILTAGEPLVRRAPPGVAARAPGGSGRTTRALPELGVQVVSRTLQLVNAARAQARSCGGRAFDPAPPLRLSPTLSAVASGHAADMAQHGYFEHRGRDGTTPAQRVDASGYRHQLVGENIAYGPESAEEVVSGWLASPGHCDNIMDPHFVDMGIAYMAGHGAHDGLYWVQLLAQPRH